MWIGAVVLLGAVFRRTGLCDDLVDGLQLANLPDEADLVYFRPVSLRPEKKTHVVVHHEQRLLDSIRYQEYVVVAIAGGLTCRPLLVFHSLDLTQFTSSAGFSFLMQRLRQHHTETLHVG